MQKRSTLYIILTSVALLVLLIGVGIVITLIKGSIPAFNEFGLNFIISDNWDPSSGKENYGALPFIIGTLYTSVIALFIAIPLSFSTAIITSEYLNNNKIGVYIRTMVDMLAGIPSIVYGLWGFYILRPFIVELGLSDQGYGIFTSSIILAIMIIPYASSIIYEVINLVPVSFKEAAYALGATKREVIFNIIIPNAKTGIFAGFILALGRALGETMAVTMLIGNSNNIPKGLFDTGNTMASLIANQFGEADGLKLSSLFAISLLLFIITAVLNYIGKFIMKKIV